jgi:hypothetical protein
MLRFLLRPVESWVRETVRKEIMSCLSQRFSDAEPVGAPRPLFSYSADSPLVHELAQD